MRAARLALLLVAVAGCGGLLDEEDRPRSPDIWPTEAPPYPATFPPMVPVPGGEADIGDFIFHEPSLQLRAAGCAAGQAFASVRVRIASFRMMETEVTNAMYRQCVVERHCTAPDADLSDNPLSESWDSPAQARKPVAVTYPLARSFCRSYGGDVPTEAQFALALGGRDGLGAHAVVKSFVRCHTGQSDPFCLQLAEAVYKAPPVVDRRAFRPLADVGTYSWDVGPFGHRDLIASAGEWLRVSGKKNATLCDPYPFSDQAYVGATDEDPFAQVALPLRSLWLPTGTLDSDWRNIDPVALVVPGSIRERKNVADYGSGFRCAFPAE